MLTHVLKSFFVVFLLCLSFSTNAQNIFNKKITLGQKKGSTQELLHAIEIKTDIVFSYSNEICLRSNIKLSKQYNTIQGFLNEIFNTCNVTYKSIKHKIIIIPAVQKNTFRISGFIKSKIDGEILIGASIYDTNTLTGTSSNTFGFYSFEIPKGIITLKSSFIGFKPFKEQILLNKDTTININLTLNSNLTEVEVIHNMSPENINTTRSGTISIPIQQINDMPAFGGEADIVRSLKLLPGINSGSEELNGFFVRGGSVDQNLFLLDDVPVYNVSHIMGLCSIFNTDAINSVSITKSGFPAHYGGRLSSIVDIRTKDGNTEKLHGSVGIGALSSTIALDGPIDKKTTFNFSVRRSYFDFYSALFQKGHDAKSSFFFYDTNLKISRQISHTAKIYASFYEGKDKFYTKFNHHIINESKLLYTTRKKMNDESNSGWNNHIGSIRWSQVYNNKLFSNMTVAYSLYNYFIGFKQNRINSKLLNYYRQKYHSGISDGLSKIDFDYFLNNNHHIKFGASYTHHIFTPGIDVIKRGKDKDKPITSTIGGKKIHGNEYYLYAEDDYTISNKFRINTGLHYASYFTNSNAYTSLQPRFSARYLLKSNIAIKASYSQMSQFMYLVNASSSSLPSNIWIPVTDKIKPQHSEQYTLGLQWQIKRNFDFSIEAYSKKNKHLLMINPNNHSSSIEDRIIFGNGYAQGIEFLIHKKNQRLNGWVGYTYSISRNRFNDINKGRYFPTLNDRRHDIGIYANYKITKRMDISATWAFSSGNAVSLPSQKYNKPTLPSQGTLVENNNNNSEYIDAINDYNMPVYHHLDLGLNMSKKIKWGLQIWTLGVYNAYGKQNAYSIYFKSNDDSNSTNQQLKQLSIFPFPIPYVRYSLKF